MTPRPARPSVSMTRALGTCWAALSRAARPRVSCPDGDAQTERARADELSRQLSVAVASVQALSRREAVLRAALAARGTHRPAPPCGALGGGECSCGLDEALVTADERLTARPWSNAHGLVVMASRLSGAAGTEVAAAASGAESLTRLLAEVEAAAR